MKRWRIASTGPLRGVLPVPSDLAIGQLALTLSALASSPGFVKMAVPREDHRTLCACLRELGVPIAAVEGGFRVAGVGVHGLRAPRAALQAGASPSTLVLAATLLASGRAGTRVLTAPALAELSVRSWVLPLRARGLHLQGTARDDGELLAPVSVAPLVDGERPLPVEIAIPQGDADTKAALLLSGMFADGITAIEEGILSRDHLERALVALELPLHTMGGMTLLDTSDGLPSWPGRDWDVPGDFSLAACIMALAMAVPGSDVTLTGVGTNRSRTALFDALRYTGARIDVTPKGDTSTGEPLSDLRVRHASISQLVLGGELAVRAMDDLAAIVALVPATKGRVAVRDAARLRERPGRLITRAVELLRLFGADASAFEDGFQAERAGPLRPAHIPADMPPELKLAGVVLAAAAAGESTLSAPEGLDALYPGLSRALTGLGLGITEEDVP